MKDILAVCLIVLFFTNSVFAINVSDSNKTINLLESTSVRNQIEEAVIIPDSNPIFGLLGSYICCWYDTNNSGLIPLIVQESGELNCNQIGFLDKYFTENNSLLVLGETVNTSYEKKEFLGTPSDISIDLASYVFSQTDSILIIPNDLNYYQLSVTAGPLASYLNIPITIFDNNSAEINQLCQLLEVNNAITIGNINVDLENITITNLENISDIQHYVVSTIKEKFGEINYITLTNPIDYISPYTINSQESEFNDHVSSVKITILGRELDLSGEDTKYYNISIPSEIQNLQIYANISNYSKKLNPIVPIIYLYLIDPSGNVVAYSSSLSYDFGKSYIETLICNASGNYKLMMKFYNGIKGGYFIQRGFSKIDTDFDVTIKMNHLEKPHMPLIPKLSILASYLTAGHGGVVVADPNFELTDNGYASAANGYAAGPAYIESLFNYNNEKVNYTVNQIELMLDLLDQYNLKEQYLLGSAWLGILAGTNMVPMYYYGPSQTDLYEKGLPSDNPYSLNWNLSVGRIIGWNVRDVSLLISRTFFYEKICGEPEKPRDWHNRFSFIFGEGFGETGGIFHQIPYALEIKNYGFYPKVFGDLRNGRLYSQLLKTYTGSNFIEYLGHADWFWYSPSLYGFDYYTKSFDVAHVKNWVFDKPSIFLSSACLMGRVDGISPYTNIGLTMLHAGCNAFLGATRETGSEAGLTTLENHLIVDDFSIGESLRGEKRIDKELPTYYVRTLYGDPAFNPYDPLHGFSNQGIPTVLS